LGRGTVNVLVPPPEHDIECPLCHGTKHWPPPDDDLVVDRDKYPMLYEVKGPTDGEFRVPKR